MDDDDEEEEDDDENFRAKLFWCLPVCVWFVFAIMTSKVFAFTLLYSRMIEWRVSDLQDRKYWVSQSVSGVKKKKERKSAILA